MKSIQNTVIMYAALLYALPFLSLLVADDIFFLLTHNGIVAGLTVMAITTLLTYITVKKEEKGIKAKLSLFASSVLASLIVTVIFSWPFSVIEPIVKPHSMTVLINDVATQTFRQSRGKGYAVNYVSDYGSVTLDSFELKFHDIFINGNKVVLFESEYETYKRLYLCNNAISSCFKLEDVNKDALREAGVSL